MSDLVGMQGRVIGLLPLETSILAFAVHAVVCFSALHSQQSHWTLICKLLSMVGGLQSAVCSDSYAPKPFGQWNGSC